MGTFIREKKIYCGKRYLEVDIYPHYGIECRSRRRKKKNISKPKQKNLNNKNARRYLTWLMNSNFTEEDYHVTCTYNQDSLPESIEDAEKEAKNFLRRLSYQMKKEGEELKYILVTEYKTKKDSDKPVRVHHHIVVNGGLTRDLIESKWCKGRGKNKAKIGRINTSRLQPDSDGLAGLSNYLTKEPAGKKRWSSSHNLVKPQESEPHDRKYSRRQIEKIGKLPPDKEYWEKKYPGWEITSSTYGIEHKYNPITGWSVYLKFKKKT